VKQYYVGHATQDNTGTYMLLTNPETDKNYEDPFVTHIPGFDGFLSTRYNHRIYRLERSFDFQLSVLLRSSKLNLDLHEVPRLIICD
jgi:hypothetical protein